MIHTEVFKFIPDVEFSSIFLLYRTDTTTFILLYSAIIRLLKKRKEKRREYFEIKD